MIRGVEQAARGAGFTLLLANSGENREREIAAINGLLARRVDGLLLAQVGGSPHSVVESIMGQGVPVVLLDRLSTPDVDQVGVETVEPMKLLVRHLLDLGHRRIGLKRFTDSSRDSIRRQPLWRPASCSLSEPYRQLWTWGSLSPPMLPRSSSTAFRMPICSLLASRVLRNQTCKLGVKLRACLFDACDFRKPPSEPSG